LQRYRLGRSLYGQGRFAEAAREFEAGLLINPESAKLSYNAARSLERAERFADSARAYEDYLRKAPNDPDATAVASLAEGLWKRASCGRL
jgi:tetratricopeptide (TPR) repeat protein